VRQQILERFKGSLDNVSRWKRSDGITNRPYVRGHVVRACSLAPPPVPEHDRLLRLVPRPAPNEDYGGYEWFGYYIRGIAYYRAGAFEEAAHCLRESLAGTNYHARALNFPVLAMALHQSGQADSARKELANARKSLDQWAQDAFQRPGVFVPVAYWHDWVECQVFYREAHLLIERSPPPEDPRLVVVRGRAFAALGRQDQADAEYVRAVGLAPEDPQIRKAVEAVKAAAKPAPGP
jgi:tetratricopeptide (TPR) repeat protein